MAHMSSLGEDLVKVFTEGYSLGREGYLYSNDHEGDNDEFANKSSSLSFLPNERSDSQTSEPDNEDEDQKERIKLLMGMVVQPQSTSPSPPSPLPHPPPLPSLAPPPPPPLAYPPPSPLPPPPPQPPPLAPPPPPAPPQAPPPPPPPPAPPPPLAHQPPPILASPLVHPHPQAPLSPPPPPKQILPLPRQFSFQRHEIPLIELLERAILWENSEIIKKVFEELNERQTKDIVLARKLLNIALLNGKAEAVKIIIDTFSSTALTPRVLGIALARMIIDDDLEICAILIERGADIFRLYLKRSFLETAKLNKRDEIADCLIIHGSKYNFFDKAKMGHTNAVRFSLDISSKYKDLVDAEGKTMLHLAAEYGRINTVRILLNYNSDTTLQDKNGQTPLHLATFNGHIDVVKLLLENGARIITKDCPKTVLEMAIESNNSSQELILTLEKCQAKRDQELLEAASQYDICHLLEALKLCSSIETCNRNNRMTALHIAAHKGYYTHVEELLKRGADQQKRDINGYTPFHYSVLSQSIEVMSLLLEAGANIDAVTNKRKTALNLAVEQDYNRKFDDTMEHSHIKMLIERRCCIDTKDDTGMTALERALADDNHIIVKVFFDCGIKDCCDEKFLKITLLYVAKKQLFDDVKLLLANGAPVDCTDEFGRTALHFVSMNGNYEIAKALVDAHTTIDIMDKSQKIPLHYAAEKGYCDIISLLIENECDVNAKDVTEKRPLNYCYANGHDEAFKLLQKNGGMFNYDVLLIDATRRGSNDMLIEALANNADVNYADINQKTSLHYASEMGNKEGVKFLIDKGAHPNCQDKGMMTSLHYAVLNGHIEIVNLLLTVLADEDVIFQTEMTEKTPLHFAVEKEYHEIVKLLLNKGAVVVMKDWDGNTPFHYASINGNFDIVWNLPIDTRLGAIRDKWDRTALHYAAEKGYINIVDRVHNQWDHFDVNIMDIHGLSPFHLSLMSKSEDTVLFLAEKGGDIYHKAGVLEQTPLHLASANGHLKAVQLILKNTSDIYVSFEEDKPEKTPLYEVSFEEYHDKGSCFQNALEEKLEAKIHLQLVSEKGGGEVSKLEIRKRRFILQQGDKYGRSPLHHAVMNNQSSVVQFLLKAGADLTATDKDDKTPFHFAVFNANWSYAARNCDWSMFRELTLYEPDLMESSLQFAINLNDERSVEALIGSSPNQPNYDLRTPLHYAANKGNVAIMQHLVNRTSRCDDLDGIKQRTALHYAAENGDVEIMKLLFTINTPINVQDEDGNTPLNLSYKNKHNWFYKHAEAVKLLKEHGGVFNNTQLLYDACVFGDMNSMNEALDNGATVTISLFGKKTLLHIAAEHGYTGLTENLIKVHNLDVNCQDSKKRIALHYAVINNHLDVCSVLLLYGANPNIRDTLKRNVWHYAAEAGHEINFDFCHADIECDDREGNTPLILASKNNHANIVNILLNKGVNINSKNMLLRTSLHVASIYNCPDIVQVLLDRKCEYLLQDEQGMTAMYYAAAFASISCLKVFLDHGVDIHVIGEKKVKFEEVAYFELARNSKIDKYELQMKTISWSTLHSAAYSGSEEVVMFLIDNGAYLGYESIRKQLTPMHSAAMNGQCEIVKLLASRGIPLDCRDEFGRTALHFACQIHAPELIEYLLSTGKVDPIATTDNGHTPISMINMTPEQNANDRLRSYELFKPFEASHKELPIETYGKVFMCGYSTAGKSSLSKVLKDRSIKPKSSFDPDEVVTDVTQYTAGIEPHTITSHEIGNVILYDFAGHTEYYSSHAAVLENLMLHSPAVFVVLFNMKKDFNVTEEELYYWFNFIENTTAKLSKKSKIIVVGSRADLFSENEELQQFRNVIRDVAKNGIIHQEFEDFVAVDCHRPAGKGVSSFVDILAKSCQDIIEESGSVSYYCCVLALFLRSLQEKAISVEKLCFKLKEAKESFLPYDVVSVNDFLKILSDRGTILYIPSQFYYGWVVIDKNFFLARINGRLLAPKSIAREYKGVASNTGIIPVSSLKPIFPEHDPEVIKGFLLSLEICQLIDATALNNVSTNMSPLNEVKSGELLFFPSLIAIESSVKMKATPTFGWCNFCPDIHKFFTTRFLHLLIQHLALRYPMKETSHGRLKKHTSHEHYENKFERHCQVWLNGIYWKRNNIEVLVEMTEHNRCLTLLISEINHCEAQNVCCSIINEIRTLKNSVCPCYSDEYIISPDQLSEVRTLNVSQRALIPIAELAKALLLQKEVIYDELQNEVLVEKVISKYEPYYCVSPVLAGKLSLEELSGKPLEESHFHHFTASCSDILEDFPMLELKNELQHCTYQSVRTYLSNFSIFVGSPVKLVTTHLQTLISGEDSVISNEAKKDLVALKKIQEMPLFSAVENSKPKRHQLVKFLLKTSSDWYMIGVLLGVDSDILNGLQNSNQPDPVRLSMVVQTWLKKKNATWQSIIDVLKDDLEKRGLANKIQEFLGISSSMKATKKGTTSLRQLPTQDNVLSTSNTTKSETPINGTNEIMPITELDHTRTPDPLLIHVPSSDIVPPVVTSVLTVSSPSAALSSTQTTNLISEPILIPTAASDVQTSIPASSPSVISSILTDTSPHTVIRSIPVPTTTSPHIINPVPLSVISPHDHIITPAITSPHILNLVPQTAISPHNQVPPNMTSLYDVLPTTTSSHILNLLPLDVTSPHILSSVPPATTLPLILNQIPLNVTSPHIVPPITTSPHILSSVVPTTTSPHILNQISSSVTSPHIVLPTITSHHILSSAPPTTSPHILNTIPPTATLPHILSQTSVATSSHVSSSVLMPVDTSSERIARPLFRPISVQSSSKSLATLFSEPDSVVPAELINQSTDPRHSFSLFTIADTSDTCIDKPTDRELRRCSQHLNNLPVLAGYLGLSDETFLHIQSTFRNQMIQGFWILKVWKNSDLLGSRRDLIELLEDLELFKAVECLLPS